MSTVINNRKSQQLFRIEIVTAWDFLSLFITVSSHSGQFQMQIIKNAIFKLELFSKIGFETSKRFLLIRIDEYVVVTRFSSRHSKLKNNEVNSDSSFSRHCLGGPGLRLCVPGLHLCMPGLRLCMPGLHLGRPRLCLDGSGLH